MIIKYLFLSLLLVFFLSGCTKISETEIGTGLLPSIDGVVTKDTSITINVKNQGGTDSISPSLYDDHALGYISDPLFGITRAVINVQMQPASFPFTFGTAVTDSLTLDSVVLALDVRGVWGDTTKKLNLHVKEIDNDQVFSYDTSFILYNNTTQFLATGGDLTYNGVASIDPETLNDSFNFHHYLDSGTGALRIRLTDDFGNRLLHYDSANQYQSDSTFRLAFKGFQISAEDAGNSLIKIGLANLTSLSAESNTKLAVYYKRKTSTGTDTAVSYFTVNTGTSAHSNFIKRDLTAGQTANYYPPSAATKNDDYIYLASSPGTYATLTIDSAALNKLPNLIVHRAEIVMEQAPDPSTPLFDNFTAPYLFLLIKPDNSLSFEKDTTKFLIPGFDSAILSTYDASFLSGTFENYSEFGGIPFRKRNTEGDSINYYNFNISRYIQGILTKRNPQYTMTLYTPYKEGFQYIKGVASYGHLSSGASVNSTAIGRVKLYGGGDYTVNPHRMKLHLVYSVPH